MVKIKYRVKNKISYFDEFDIASYVIRSAKNDGELEKSKKFHFKVVIAKNVPKTIRFQILGHFHSFRELIL